MNNTPINSSFHESHDVRIQIIDGAPWFCLKDVCEVLSVSVASPSRVKMEDVGVAKNVIPTSGGNQQLTFVNEPNLYSVILRSNKPEAKQFQDWGFNEVLPTIGKTGSYHSGSISEPISTKQQEQIKRLIWCASLHMRFSQSWSNGVCHALRAATGTPSPQPSAIDDLPILKQEFERILKITAATNSVIYIL